MSESAGMEPTTREEESSLAGREGAVDHVDVSTETPSRRLYSAIIEGMQLLEQDEQEARLKRKGTLDRTSPFMSDIGACDRALALDYMNAPKTHPIPPEQLLVFEVGHAFEAAIAKALQRVFPDAVTLEMGVRIPVGETSIAGRLDVLLWSPSMKAILELKTTQSYAILAMLRDGERGKPNHQHQLNGYGYAARQGLFGEDLKDFEHLFLVYLPKDRNSRVARQGVDALHVWEVAYDEDTALEDFAELEALWNAAKDGSVPGVPEDFKRDRFPCGWGTGRCSFWGHCWGGEK